MREPTRRQFQSRELAIALLVICRFAFGELTWATGPTVTFNIPAGDFSQTIVEFRRQANVRVWYVSLNGSVSGIATHAVSGTLSASDALARLLEGTGFAADWESETSVYVHEISTKVPDSTPQASPRARTSTDPASATHSGPKEIAEVLVTGTYLRDADAVTAPMIQIRRSDLNRTGYATSEAALDDLPMNFGGGARMVVQLRNHVSVLRYSKISTGPVVIPVPAGMSALSSVGRSST